MRRLLARIAYRLLTPELDDLTGNNNPLVLQRRLIALQERQGPELLERLQAFARH